MHGLQFLLELSVCMVHVSGCTCPETGLAIVLGDGPISLHEFRKLLQTSQPFGKHLRTTPGKAYSLVILPISYFFSSSCFYSH